MNSMETTPSKKRRRWFVVLLHLVAWGVTLAVGAGFVFANVPMTSFHKYVLDSEDVFGDGIITYFFCGWPNDYREYDFTSSLGIVSTFHPVPLFFNVLVGMLIVAATFFVFVFPLWRRQNLFQVKLESLFIFTATIAILCALYRMANPIHPPMLIFDISQHDPATRFVYMSPLYLQIPLGLGIGCTIYMGIWLPLRFITALGRRIGNNLAKREATS